MSVSKAVDLTASASTIESAVQVALDRAASTLEGVTAFDVRRISGELSASGLTYHVQVRVWFTLLERMHG